MYNGNNLFSSKCSLNPCFGTSHYRSVETDFVIVISPFLLFLNSAYIKEMKNGGLISYFCELQQSCMGVQPMH